MSRLWNTALLSAVLLTQLTMAPIELQAQDREQDRNAARTYHDKQHNDDHEWNSHEDQAYRIWVKERHRKYTDFNRVKEEDQQAYWAWRHEHSDAVLKIDIR